MCNRSRVSVITQEAMVTNNNVAILVMVTTIVKVDITNNKVVVKVATKVVKEVKVVKVDRLDPRVNRRTMVKARRN